MVGLELVVRIAKDKRQEFMQAFDMLTRLEDRDDACLDQWLFQETEESDRFLWREHWSDSKSLEAYLKTDRFRSLRGAIDVLGILEDLSMVEFKSISD